jgi:hypothetical protein
VLRHAVRYKLTDVSELLTAVLVSLFFCHKQDIYAYHWELNVLDLLYGCNFLCAQACREMCEQVASHPNTGMANLYFLEGQESNISYLEGRT